MSHTAVSITGSALLVVGGFCPSAPSAKLTNGAPTSGVVAKAESTIWFDGIHKRLGTRNEAQVTMIHVTGDKWWAAYPRCGIGDRSAPDTPINAMGLVHSHDEPIGRLGRGGRVSVGF